MQEDTADWNSRSDQVIARHGAIKTVWADWQTIDKNAPIDLSYIDLFVQYAQEVLDKRSRLFYWVGGLLALSCILVLIISYIAIYLSDVITLLARLKDISSTLDNIDLIYIFMRNIGLAALVGGVAYFLGSLATAFLHEATVLHNRRHALRQGRLYLYLKFSEASDLQAVKSKLTIEELETAFGWNLQSATAFRKMNLDPLSASLYARLVDKGGDVAKAFANQSKS